MSALLQCILHCVLRKLVPSCWPAGINNIMAYSWPSHCKKYLEVLEAEKQFLRRQQVRSLSSFYVAERAHGSCKLAVAYHVSHGCRVALCTACRLHRSSDVSP